MTAGSGRYERNRNLREAQRQRSLMGETLAQFHDRERPRVEIGDRLPRVRCKATDDLFAPAALQLFDKDWSDQ